MEICSDRLTIEAQEIEGKMNYPKYIDIERSKDLRTFRFQSDGPNGAIWKVVQFLPTGKRGIYNLGFGDQQDHEILDDFIVSNNGDRDKILATVASTVYTFLDRYPRRSVFFQGSSSVRTRLYRMAINKAIDELEELFEIEGLVRAEQGRLQFQKFEKGGDFIAFMVRKRLVGEYPNPPP